jgi:hypothetical protein
MKQIKPWVEENHDGDVKLLSERSDIAHRTLCRYVKDNVYVVDDEGNMYKKIGKLNPNPKRIENIKKTIREAFMDKKNKMRSELIKLKLVR